MKRLLGLLLVMGMVGCGAEATEDHPVTFDPSLPVDTIVLRSVKPPQRGDRTVIRYGLTRSDHRRISNTLPNIRRTVPKSELDDVELSQILITVKDIEEVKLTVPVIDSLLKKYHEEADYVIAVTPLLKQHFTSVGRLDR